MDVTLQPIQRTYPVVVTLTQDELLQLKGAQEIIPDTAVVAKDLINRIVTAVEGQ